MMGPRQVEHVAPFYELRTPGLSAFGGRDWRTHSQVGSRFTVTLPRRLG